MEAYLASSLLKRGYEVHGTSRDKENSTYSNLRRLGIHDQITCHSAVLDDFRSVVSAIKNVSPAHIYNLAAQSSVGLSFEQPVETIDSIMHGTINILEAMRFLSLDAKFYNAASSECFGNTTKQHPADESTMFRPRSPYAVGKAASFWAVANYREAYGLFGCSGVLFNHESPLRPARFVTQKIIRAAMDIANRPSGLAEPGRVGVGARLGLGSGICRGHESNAGTRRAGGFHHRDRGDQHFGGLRRGGVLFFWPRLARTCGPESDPAAPIGHHVFQRQPGKGAAASRLEGDQKNARRRCHIGRSGATASLSTASINTATLKASRLGRGML